MSKWKTRTGRLMTEASAAGRRACVLRARPRITASLRKACGVALSASVLAQSLLVFGAAAATATPALAQAGGQQGTRGSAVAATVNVTELSQQVALSPQSTPAEPRAIHAPLSEPNMGENDLPAGYLPPAPAEEISQGPPVGGGGEEGGGWGAPSGSPTEGGGEEPQPNVPSPAFSTNFSGAVDTQVLIPPDTMGAVGPNHVVTAVNDTMNIKTRAGALITSFTTNSFWDPLEPTIGYSLNVFDPKIHYDRFTGRWIYTITANAQSPNSAVLLAVSRTGDPTGTWNLYGVDSDAGNTNWADYPSIGFNGNWIVVSVNIFTNAGNVFQRPEIYIFNKANAVANTPSIGFTKITGTNSTAGNGMGGSTWAPSIDADNSSPNKMWFVQNWNQTNGLVRISTITGAVGAEVVTPGVQFPQAPFSWNSQPVLLNGGWAPQANDAKTAAFGTFITNNDARMQNLVYRNGSLWATHTVFGPTVKQPAGTPANSAANPTNHSFVQWWEINPAIETNTISAPLQRAYIEDPTATNCFNGTTGFVPGCTVTGNFYAFPTIAVNDINDVLIGFSHFSPTRWATAAYAYRDHTDAPNTFRDVADFKEAATSGRYSKSAGGNVRWGDYSATMTDPINDRNFWTTQEFGDVRANAGATSVWATWWAQVNAISQAANTGQLNISEFRLQGPNGANDEFIEIYNASGASHTVSAIDVATGGLGYSVVASDGVARCTIPNGTVIPAGGHYLCVNSVGYSQASYPAGNGTTATGDATFTLDIPRNAGIALFRTSTAVGFTVANRLDAVGSASEANVLYKEGTGYPDINDFNVDYAILRDLNTGNPKDTNNNEADFDAVDSNGTNMCTTTLNFSCQRLGAAGPENLSSPIQRYGAIFGVPLDPCVSSNVAPNRVRTPCPCSGVGCQCAAQNATFGTLSIRRTFINNTGGPLTRLRFRVTDMTTFPVPTGTADLRLVTSANAVTPDAPFSVTVDRAPCGTGTMSVTVEPTTLETSGLGQPNGGGFNSSVSAGTITLANPLPAGGEINVQFLLGVQQSGSFRFFVTIEALP